MDHVALGRSGLRVPRLCIGTAGFGAVDRGAWRVAEPSARRIVAEAIDAGLTFFDTGPTYGAGEAESILGRAIGFAAARDACVLASKVYFPTGPGPNDRGLSRRHVFASVEGSLRRLQTDRLDLLYVHRWDPETPVEETLRALEDLVHAGKVRYLGASSMSAWRFMKMLMLQRHGGYAPFVAMQNHYNLVYREEEREMLPLCVEEGVGVLPWSPLARGLLAGADAAGLRRNGDPLFASRHDPALDAPIVAALQEVASARGESCSAVALAWLLTRPGVVGPVVGIDESRQLSDARRSLELRLEPGECARLERSYVPRAVSGHEPESRAEQRSLASG